MIQGNGFIPPGRMNFFSGKPGLGLGRLKKLQGFPAAPPFMPPGIPFAYGSYPPLPGMIGGPQMLNGIMTVLPPQPGFAGMLPGVQQPPSGMTGAIPGFVLQPVAPPPVQPPSPDALFVKLDANRDGVITRQELNDTPNPTGLPLDKDQAWKAIDINGDGQITRVEFLQFSTQNQAEQLFGKPPNLALVSNSPAPPQGLNTVRGTLQAFGFTSP